MQLLLNKTNDSVHYIPCSIFTPVFLFCIPSLPALSLLWQPFRPALLSGPRGDEQTPIITQVSVKWITGWLIELLDGKHPSWLVQLGMLRLLSHLLSHLSADAWQGWHAHFQRHCWGSEGVVCSPCVPWHTRCDMGRARQKQPCRNRLQLRTVVIQRCMMRCDLRLFCVLHNNQNRNLCKSHFNQWLIIYVQKAWGWKQMSITKANQFPFFF